MSRIATSICLRKNLSRFGLFGLISDHAEEGIAPSTSARRPRLAHRALPSMRVPHDTVADGRHGELCSLCQQRPSDHRFLARAHRTYAHGLGGGASESPPSHPVRANVLVSKHRDGLFIGATIRRFDLELVSVIRKFETVNIAREGRIWPIWFVTLGGGFQVDGLLFDVLPSL